MKSYHKKTRPGDGNISKEKKETFLGTTIIPKTRDKIIKFKALKMDFMQPPFAPSPDMIKNSIEQQKKLKRYKTILCINYTKTGT